MKEKVELPAVMTIAEVMEAARLSRGTVYLHIKEGRLLAAKVGRRVLIQRDDFKKFIAPNNQGKASP